MHRDFQDAGHLLGLRDKFAIMAALREEMFGMRLLKITAADFIAGNLRGNGQDRNAAAVAVVEPVDQMQVSRTATSCADG